jgi:hydrogenase maturation protease
MTRTLVAGIGNIFFGDDAFGCEVARALAGRSLPDGVLVKDFGIRTLDLAYALLDDFDEVILIDAISRGRPPGTLCLLDLAGETAEHELPAPPGGHGVAPHQVLAQARALGAKLPSVRLVGCEPESFGDESEPRDELSAPVQAAVSEAACWVEQLLRGELPSGAVEVA